MADTRMEDAFRAFFSGDSLENALDFAEFLGANEMVYDGAYEIHYKGSLVCYIDTPNAQQQWWSIWTAGDCSCEHEAFPIDARTKEIAWANVVKCGNCDGTDCNPGKTEVIFGKTFANVCRGAEGLAMRFMNPDAEALACVKMLLMMRKYGIDGQEKASLTEVYGKLAQAEQQIAEGQGAQRAGAAAKPSKRYGRIIGARFILQPSYNKSTSIPANCLPRRRFQRLGFLLPILQIAPRSADCFGERGLPFLAECFFLCGGGLG